MAATEDPKLRKAYNDLIKKKGRNDPATIAARDALNADRKSKGLATNGGTSTGVVPREKSAYEKSIAKAGTKTSGTKIGDVREINPATIDPAAQYEAAQIDPIRDASNPNLAPAREISGAAIDRSGDQVYRNAQSQLISELQRASRGEGPSVAEMQLKQALERQISGMYATAAATRGVNPALALRQVLQGGAGASQVAAQEAAKQRVAEMLAARAEQANVISQGRETERLFAGQQADLSQQAQTSNQTAVNTNAKDSAEFALRADLANQTTAADRAKAQASLTTQARGDNATAINTRATGQANLNQDAATKNQTAFNAANTAQLQSNTGVKQTQISGAAQTAAAGITAAGGVTEANINNEGANYRNDVNAAVNSGQGQATSGQAFDNSNTGAAQGAANAVNEIAGAATGAAVNNLTKPAGKARDITSDRRAKKNIQPGDDAVQSFLDALNARTFQYKAGGGPQAGVIAQDAERSPVGSAIVKEENGVKKLDGKKALSAALASVANLNKRIEYLESATRKPDDEVPLYQTSATGGSIMRFRDSKRFRERKSPFMDESGTIDGPN